MPLSQCRRLGLPKFGEPTVGIGFPEIIVTFLIDKPQLGNGFLGLKRGYNPRQQKQQRLESGLQHPQK
jgi:hypothetical protein